MQEQPNEITLHEPQLPTISSKVMFWRPRYLADSQWLQHIPFYFWLTEVLQPKTVVEPNLNSAVGYFAICQAIDKLNLDTVSYAAFGKQCNTNRVKAYNYEHYRDFSDLQPLSENDLIDERDDEEIDFLLLKHDSQFLIDDDIDESLQRKLSHQAIVLIHGSKTKPIRHVCKKLRNRYPSFELTQGQGVLLLCIGTNMPAKIKSLINQAKDHSAQRLIQNIYARLGCANEDAWQCQVYEQRVHELTDELQQQTHNIQQIQGAKQQLAETLKQANSEVSTTKAHQAKLTAQLAALGEETTANQQQKQRLEQEKAALDEELIQLKHSRKNASDDIAKLQQDIDTRFDELAKLTEMLVDAEHKLESVQKDNKSLREQLNQSQQTFEQTKTENQNITQQLSELTTLHAAQVKDNRRLKDSLNQVQEQLTNSQLQAAKYVDESEQFKRQQQQVQSELKNALAAKEAERQKACSAQAQLKQQLIDTQQQLQQTQDSLKSANRVQEQLNIKLTQQQSEISKLNTKLTTTQSELTQQTELNTLLERDQTVAADKVSQLKQSELNLQQSLNERFDELATLTNLLQQKEQELEASINDIQAKQQLHQAQPANPVSNRLKNSYKAAKQRRAKAKQFALDAELIRQSELFDEAWYIKQYPEAQKHKHGAAGHYLERAVELGANPSAAFDGNWYLQAHQDVKNSGMNPLFHYLKFGHKESRLLKHF